MGYKSSSMNYKVSDSRLKDNTQASPVKKIKPIVNSDMGRVNEKKMDNRGYSQEAWNYKY